MCFTTALTRPAIIKKKKKKKKNFTDNFTKPPILAYRTSRMLYDLLVSCCDERCMTQRRWSGPDSGRGVVFQTVEQEKKHLSTGQ